MAEVIFLIVRSEVMLSWVELNWLFNVTINYISVIYVTAHRYAGGLKKKLWVWKDYISVFIIILFK